MDLILEELRENNIDIDMRTLTYYINYCLERYECMFREIAAKSPSLEILFYRINVNNFGRAMTYLALVYKLQDTNSQEVTRRAVRLVVTPLKNIDFTVFKIEESFFRGIIRYIGRVFKR